MNLQTEIEEYIKKIKPFGINEFTIKLLGSGEYNNNYLLETNNQKYVARVSTSQLTGDVNQLQKEYDVLKYLNGKNISPEVYFIDMNGFKFPFLFEEFIEGTEIIDLKHETLEFIGSMIARINNVQIIEPHPFEVREVNYIKDINVSGSL